MNLIQVRKLMLEMNIKSIDHCGPLWIQNFRYLGEDIEFVGNDGDTFNSREFVRGRYKSNLKKLEKFIVERRYLRIHKFYATKPIHG